MEFEIPEGLTDLLQDFTVSVLREKPGDLIQFAEDYFKTLNECRSDRDLLGRKGVRFGGPGDASPMQTDNSDDEPSVPPKNTFQRRKSVSAERYDPEADDDGDEEKIIHPKSDEQRKRLNETIHNILIFRSLDAEQLQEVIDAMFEKVVQPDEHVIDQGADGDNFYVIVSGTFDICVNVDGTEKAVGSYANEGSFGELALMYNMPRAATIIATSEGTLWAMDRATFRRIVLKTAFNKRKMYENLLENVPMLKTLEAYERMNVADALVSRTFQNDELIIRQGDNADCMYFVEDGEVRITIKQTEACAEVEVTRCNTGQYFGELALLTHKPRAASAYANGIVKCAVLDVRAFERLLGPCMDILKRNISDYEGQLVSLFGSTSNMTDLR